MTFVNSTRIYNPLFNVVFFNSGNEMALFTIVNPACYEQKAGKKISYSMKCCLEPGGCLQSVAWDDAWFLISIYFGKSQWPTWRHLDQRSGIHILGFQERELRKSEIGTDGSYRSALYGPLLYLPPSRYIGVHLGSFSARGKSATISLFR